MRIHPQAYVAALEREVEELRERNRELVDKLHRSMDQTLEAYGALESAWRPNVVVRRPRYGRSEE